MVSCESLVNVAGNAYNHLCLGVDGVLQFLEVNGPLRGRRGSCGTILGRMKGHIADGTTRHLNIANVPIPPMSVYGRHGA